MKTSLFALLAIGLLSGCASGGRCVSEAEYLSAQTLLPPAAVEGVRLPSSGAALKIPAETANPVPFAQQMPHPDKPGETRTRCLDVPTAMPLPEPVKEPVKPATSEAPAKS